MIYIVYSPEKEILEHEVSKIIKYEDVINFDYNEVEHEYIISEILAIDLFVEKKCFIINNSKFLTNKSSSIKDNTLKSMFNSFSTTEHDIIFSIQKPLLKDIALSYSDIINYLDFDIEIQQWSEAAINNFIGDQKINISQKNLDLLSNNLNNDYSLVVNELMRLSLVNTDNLITEDIINDFSFSVLEADVFLFIDSIMHGKKKQARALYDQLIGEGSNPVSLLEMFATQIRFHYQVLLLSKLYKQKEIATLLKANPYRVSITLKSLNKISHIQVINKYKKTAELEYLSKAGKINTDIVFDLLI